MARRDRPQLTLDADGHREFARALNRAVWEGLASDRDDRADALLVDTAHASLEQWRIAGGPLEEARGEWLVSHVYAVLGRGMQALHHVRRSYDLCVAHGFGDFDLAYAYEGLARATAVASGDPGDWRAKAAEQGAAIAEPEDRALFESDLGAGPW